MTKAYSASASARARPMMKAVRISPAASGCRAMASEVRPVSKTDADAWADGGQAHADTCGE